jgi:hypothetical protein
MTKVTGDCLHDKYSFNSLVLQLVTDKIRGWKCTCLMKMVFVNSQYTPEFLRQYNIVSWQLINEEILY